MAKYFTIYLLFGLFTAGLTAYEHIQQKKNWVPNEDELLLQRIAALRPRKRGLADVLAPIIGAIVVVFGWPIVLMLVVRKLN